MSDISWVERTQQLERARRLERTQRLDQEEAEENYRLQRERDKAAALEVIRRRVFMLDHTFDDPTPEPASKTPDKVARHETAVRLPDQVEPMRCEVDVRDPDDLAADVEPTDVVPPDHGLSELEARFAREYAVNPNGAAAARVAGYSSKGAKVSAVRLLRRVAVISYINHLREHNAAATPDPADHDC